MPALNLLIQTQRFKNQSAQIALIKQQRNRSIGQVETYAERDPVTGLRKTIGADGGVNYRVYISNSSPQTVPPVAVGGQFGLPGYLNQKPS